MKTTIDTPVGWLRATFAREGALCRLCFGDGGERGEDSNEEEGARGLGAALAAQFDAYFRGEEPAFDVPLVLEGGAFERIQIGRPCRRNR